MSVGNGSIIIVPGHGNASFTVPATLVVSQATAVRCQIEHVAPNGTPTAGMMTGDKRFTRHGKLDGPQWACTTEFADITDHVPLSTRFLASGKKGSTFWKE